jgi:UDP-sugar pyrophosphorylase
MPEPLLSPSLSETMSFPDELRTELPHAVQDAIAILPLSQQELIKKLYVDMKQIHLFDGFNGQIPPTVRRMYGQQLEELDAAYQDGGLVGYITNARKLLDDSRRGANPYLGWTPTIPAGEMYKIGSDQWKKAESHGMQELGSVGFVLVAGGLGERLGYSSIKVR